MLLKKITFKPKKLFCRGVFFYFISQITFLYISQKLNELILLNISFALINMIYQQQYQYLMKKSETDRIVRLPQISIRKKEKIIGAAKKFDNQYQIIENQQKLNNNSQNKWEQMFGMSNRSNSSKMLKTLAQHARSQRKGETTPQKKTPLKRKVQSVKKIKITESEFTNTKRLFRETSSDFIQQKKPTLILGTSLKKQTLPFYSSTSEKPIELPFTNVDESENQIRVRFTNGYEKMFNKNNVYYRVGEKEQKQKERKQIQQRKKLQHYMTRNEINMNQDYLERLVLRFAEKKKLRKSMLDELLILLKDNYKMSMAHFSLYYKDKKQRISAAFQSSPISVESYELEHKLFCSQKLHYLHIFSLNKISYIPLINQTYFLLYQLGCFSHYHFLYTVKETKKVSQLFTEWLNANKYKIQQIIFRIQSHLQLIKDTIGQDVEYVRKLNPKFRDFDHIKLFSTWFSEYSLFAGVLVRSILSDTVFRQIEVMMNFLEKYNNIPFTGVLKKGHPDTDFYRAVFKINQPFLTPLNQQILVGPCMVPLAFQIHKLKRRNIFNIYKFVLGCRKKIRQFSYNQQTILDLELAMQNRLSIEPVYQQFRKNVILPIEGYLESISTSENVNGCINNSQIQLHDQGLLNFLKDKLGKIAVDLQLKIVKKYHIYFSYWELYLMQKSYMDEMILLFRRINGIKFMQDEMNHLKCDLQIIQGFPDILIEGIIRIDITLLKKRVIKTIQSYISKILSASEEVLIKLLEIGYQETIKAKKLNQIQPYTNIAEYVTFVNALNSRSVQRQIQKVAANSVVIKQNWDFLETNKYEVKHSTMLKYLQSRIWVKVLRKAADENKGLLVVDPMSFTKSLGKKKSRVYQRFAKILKQITELIKVQQLVNWDRYAMLSQNLYTQLVSICQQTQEIQQEQILLELDFCSQEDAQSSKKDNLYRQDLTFLYKERCYLKKFQRFWSYASKFKNYLKPQEDNKLIQIDGENLLHQIRLGQEMLYDLKINLVNKRLLGLVEVLSLQMQPFIKMMKIIKVACSGSQNARIKMIEEIRSQISTFIEKKKEEQLNEQKRKLQYQKLRQERNSPQPKKITIQQPKKPEKIQQKKIEQKNMEEQNSQISKLMGFMRLQYYQITLSHILYSPLPPFQYQPFYETLIREKQREKTRKKIQQIYQGIKSSQISLIQINGLDGMSEYQIVRIPFDLLQLVEYYGKELSEWKRKSQDKLPENQKQMLRQCMKKVQVFHRSLLKMNELQKQVHKLYTWFQLLLPALQPVSIDIISQYSPTYITMMGDYCKKCDLIKKLTFATIYEDKVRINYDEELKKMKQMLQKVYGNHVFGIKNMSQSKVQPHILLSYLQNALLHKSITNPYKKKIKQAFGQNKTNNRLPKPNLFPMISDIQYEILQQPKAHLKVISIQTPYRQRIQINRNYLLFKVMLKEILLEEEKKIVQLVQCGFVVLLSKIQKQIEQNLHQQTLKLVNVLYQLHYNVKNIFQLYLAINGCLFQAVLSALQLIFYMDLTFTWENDYDIKLLREKIRECRDCAYEAKQAENTHFIENIYSLYDQFLTTIDMIVREKQMVHHSNEARKKKKLIFEFLPKIYVNGYWQQERLMRNHEWLFGVKKQKQDDFILQTHMNPVLLQLLGRPYSLQKIELKEVEKKQSIESIQLCKTDLPSLLSSPPIMISSYGDFTLEYSYSYVRSPQSINAVSHMENRLISTTMWLQSLRQNKLYITNVQPLYHLLGRHYQRVLSRTRQQAYQVFVITSDEELMKTVNTLLQGECSTTIIWYSNLNQQQLLTGQHTKQKVLIYHSNTPPRYLNTSIHCPSYQLLSTFRCTPLNQNMFTFQNSPIKAVFDSNKLSISPTYKQKQLIWQSVCKYYAQRNCHANAHDEEATIQAIFSTVFAIPAHSQHLDKLRHVARIREHMILGQREKQMDFMAHKHPYNVSLYAIPVYAMPIQQILPSASSYHPATSIIHHIVTGNTSQLKEYLIEGPLEGDQKWFILDLSLHNTTTKKVFAWLHTWLQSGTFTYPNNTLDHFQPIRQHPEMKIIIRLHEDLCRHRLSIPILGVGQVFNSITYFNIQFPSILKIISSQSPLPHLRSFYQLVKQCDLDLDYEMMLTLVKMLRIMMNQLRKWKLANGMFNQNDVPVQHRHLFIMSSVESREKHKLNQSSMMEMQEIQKQLDHHRKRVFRSKQHSTGQWLTQTQHQKLTHHLNIINSTPDHNIPSKIIHQILVFCVCSCLHLYRKSKQKVLEKYPQADLFFNVQAGRFEDWIGNKSISSLDVGNCSADTRSMVVQPMEILRLTGNRNALLKAYVAAQTHPPPIQSGYVNGDLFWGKMFILYGEPFLLTGTNFPHWSIAQQLHQLSNHYISTHSTSNSYTTTLTLNKKKTILHSLPPTCNYNLPPTPYLKALTQYGLLLYESQHRWRKNNHNSFVLCDMEDPLPIPTINIAQVEEVSAMHLISMYTPYSMANVGSKLEELAMVYHTYQHPTQNITKLLEDKQLWRIYGYSLQYPEQLKKQTSRQWKQLIMQRTDSESKQKLALILQQWLNSTQLHKVSSKCKQYLPRYMLHKPKKYKTAKPTYHELIPIDKLPEAQMQESSRVALFHTHLMLFHVYYPHANSLSAICDHVQGEYGKGFSHYLKSQLVKEQVGNNKIFSIWDKKMGKWFEEYCFVCRHVEAYHADVYAHKLSSCMNLHTQQTTSQTQGSKVIGQLIFVHMYCQPNITRMKQQLHPIHPTYRYIVIHYGSNPSYETIYKQQQLKEQQHPQQMQDIPFYLQSIHQDKIVNLKQKILHWIGKRKANYIQTHYIGQHYQAAIEQKGKAIKEVTEQNQLEQENRKTTWQNSLLEITSCTAQIQQLQQSIDNQTQQQHLNKAKLAHFQNKLTYYQGQQLYNHTKHALKQQNRKQLQKQLLTMAYLEDNSFNLFFIYLFNIVGDAEYFSEKSSDVVEKQYHLEGAYPVDVDQKKQFMKLISYGRLNVLLENEDLLFSEEQLQMAYKLRECFVYLRAPMEDKKEYGENSPLTLESMVSDALTVIDKASITGSQAIFHKFLLVLFTHRYNIQMLSSGEKSLQYTMQSSQNNKKVMIEKLDTYKTILSNLQRSVVGIEKKYHQACRDLEYSRDCERVFAEISADNIEKVSEVYLYKLFGKLADASDQLATYVVTQLRKLPSQRQSLSPFLCRLLLYLVGVPQLNNLLSKEQKPSETFIRNADDLYMSCVKHMLREVGVEYIVKGKEEINEQEYNIREGEQVQGRELMETLYPEVKVQMGRLVGKIGEELDNLEVVMGRFGEKVELVMARSLQSIKKFSLTSSIIDAVMQSYTPLHIDYHLTCITNLQQKTSQILKHVQPIPHHQYYHTLFGCIIRKSTLPFEQYQPYLNKVMQQLLYDHGEDKIMSNELEEALEEVPLHKCITDAPDGELYRRVSVMDSVLMLDNEVLLVEGDVVELLPAKASKYNADIEWLEDHIPPYYYPRENTSLLWVVYPLPTLSSLTDVLQLKTHIEQLYYQVESTEQANTKYIFIIPNKHIAQLIDLHIQPVYRVFSGVSVLGKLAYRRKQHLVGGEREMQLEMELLLAIYGYYAQQISSNEVNCLVEDVQMYGKLHHSIKGLPYHSNYALLHVLTLLGVYVGSPKYAFLCWLIEHQGSQLTTSLVTSYASLTIANLSHSEQQSSLLKMLKKINQYWEGKQTKYSPILASNSIQQYYNCRVVHHTDIENPFDKDFQQNEKAKTFTKFFHQPQIRNQTLSLGQKQELSGREMIEQQQLLEHVMSDPIIYLLISKTFRRVVKKIMNKRKKNGVLQSHQRNRRPIQYAQLNQTIQEYGSTGYKKLLLMIWGKSQQSGHRMEEYIIKLHPFINQDSSLIEDQPFTLKGMNCALPYETFSIEIQLSDKKAYEGLFMQYTDPPQYPLFSNYLFEDESETKKPLPQTQYLIPVLCSSSNKQIGILQAKVNRKIQFSWNSILIIS